MELREIRSFVVLAEQLHFGRAAEVLHLTQPALTKQIRRLEAELSGTLFTRNRHGTQLTALGQQFLRGARTSLQDFDDLLDRTQQSAVGTIGRLRIGFGFHTFELVPQVVVKLRRNAPAVELTLRDMSTAEQVEALRSGRIDLGFVRLPVAKQFATLPVIEDRLMLVSSAAPGDPAHLTLRDCRDRPFILISPDRSPTFHQHAIRLCARHGFHPRIVQEVPEVTTALALVRAGLGLTMIPQSFGTTHFSGLHFHKLQEPEARWQVGAAWRKGETNPLLHRFLALLKSEVKTRP